MDPGFDPQRPVTLAVVLPAAGDGGPKDVDCEAIRERLLRIGGVRAAAYGRIVPMSGREGPVVRLELPGEEMREIRGGSAGAGFLSMLGVRFLAGRDLRPNDERGVVINAALARQLDREGRAVVGRQIRLDGALREVVGVFPDIAWNTIYDAPRPRALGLTPGRAGGDMTFAIESGGDPAAIVGPVRAELAAFDRNLTVPAVNTLAQQYRDALFMERLATQVFYALGALALLLTATGLHGIANALFVRRSKEFAIRMALGAAPGDVVRQFLGSGLKLAAIGFGIGLAITLPVGVWIASKVPGFEAWTLPAVGLSAALVLTGCLAATLRPARRVLRIAPGTLVRTE
jgi:hypothetical protein